MRKSQHRGQGLCGEPLPEEAHLQHRGPWLSDRALFHKHSNQHFVPRPGGHQNSGKFRPPALTGRKCGSVLQNGPPKHPGDQKCERGCFKVGLQRVSGEALEGTSVRKCFNMDLQCLLGKAQGGHGPPEEANSAIVVLQRGLPGCGGAKRQIGRPLHGKPEVQ